MSVDLDTRQSLAPGSGPGSARRRLPRRVYGSRSAFEFRLTHTWTYRRAIPFLGWSLVMRRFRGTFLGWLWLPLRPTLQILSRAFVFGGMLQVGSGDRPYLIFLLAGQASWDLFDKAVYWSFRPLNSHRRVLASVPIPWAAAVAAALVPAVIDAAQYVGIGLIASCYYRLTKGSFFLATSIPTGAQLLAGIALLVLWAYAVGLVIGPLVVKARDVRFIIRYVLSFWYFLTPVLYATSSLPASYRGFAVYNPITAPIEMIKNGLLGTGAPSGTSLAVSLIGLAVMLPAGLLTCAYFERQMHARL
jgi:ABC-type polysaccharide/polyol phosphate export permease